MTMTTPSPPQQETLLDYRDALDVYMRALLRDETVPGMAPEVEVEVEAAVAAVEPELRVSEPVAEPAVAPAEPAVTTVAPPVAPAEPTVTTVAPAVAPTEPAVATAIESTTTSEHVGEPTATERLPRWAEGRFQTLLFRVTGLTLAVPLVELSGVQVWARDQVTPMPGHADWYLGLMEYRGRQVPIIDTALLVLPADRRLRLPEPEERLQRVVFIADGRWGLACNEVAEVIALEQSAVRWRTQRSRRRWLAGTVIEQMCAIIDPPAFAEMLANGVELAAVANAAATPPDNQATVDDRRHRSRATGSRIRVAASH